jgi:hypothetical protein
MHLNHVKSSFGQASGNLFGGDPAESIRLVQVICRLEAGDDHGVRAAGRRPGIDSCSIWVPSGSTFSRFSYAFLR